MGIGRGCLFAACGVVALGVIGSIFGHSATTGPQRAAGNSTGISSADAPADGPQWQYSIDQDELRETRTSHATLTSTNQVDFDFPYNGGSDVTITVRHDHSGDNVYFHVSKGQFLCGFNSCRGDINIDGLKRRLSLLRSGDGGTDTVFANGEAGLIASFRKAKHIIVELPFFREGNRQFDFSASAPLQWPIPKDTPVNPAS